MEGSHLFQGQHAAFTWFTDSQRQSVIRNNVIPEWFHGIISRKRAEELLMSKPAGHFLIRVSESRIGYSLSYRLYPHRPFGEEELARFWESAEDCCRHFMIDLLDDGHYIIVGENRRHRFLQDLVDFHQRTPIIPYMEVLTFACEQNRNVKTDYAELVFPQKHLNHDTNFQTNNSPLLSTIYPVMPEDVPPALPHQRNNLSNCAVPSPNSQSNTLYTGFEKENPHATAPAEPVPMPRRRYATDNPVSKWTPEVPPLTQAQDCGRTVSEPESVSSPRLTEHPFHLNIQSAKNQEAKPSAVSNKNNLKKKFQKNTGMCTENNMEAMRKTQNEHQVITGEQCQQFPYTDANDGGLPSEYRTPPPFAPGNSLTATPLENSGYIRGLWSN